VLKSFEARWWGKKSAEGGSAREICEWPSEGALVMKKSWKHAREREELKKKSVRGGCWAGANGFDTNKRLPKTDRKKRQT